MEEKHDGTFGLLTFVNKDEFDSFKDDINNFRRDVYKEIRKIHITRFPYNAFLYPDIT